MPREALPIDAVLPELIARLESRGVVVLQAPTGAGKTTRVPPAILAAKLAPQRILMIEPRRVAARAAAARMAAEDGSPLGDRIGYAVRFDRQFGPQTRILVLTPGILARMIQDDPFLENVSAILFDEFHERGLETDLLLGMAKLLHESVRPDLKLVVMSATLQTEAVAAFLNDAPVVVSQGRSYPVMVQYRPTAGDPLNGVNPTVREVLRAGHVGMLVFLPGLREIREAAEGLADVAGVPILPLHGELPPAEQDRALRLPPPKIVLATNVAETSVTVEGITHVIDTGVARQLQFDARVGMDRLELVPISQAAAEQRSGRAGRLGPGTAIRLWDESNHRARAAQTTPEIRRLDLAPALFQLLAFGESNIEQFPWLEPPRAESLQIAEKLLEQLGLIQSRQLTPLGQKLARWPVHPRLARLLDAGQQHGVPQEVALAAALLTERDPFVRREGPGRTGPTSSDLLDRVDALFHFNQTRQTEFPCGRLSPPAARQVLQAQRQLLRVLDSADESPELSREEAFARALLAAYPDRLAKSRGTDRRARMMGGRGLRLAPSSGVDTELFLAVDVDAGDTESWVRIASGVERSWLPPELVTIQQEVEFDDASERLQARKRTRIGDLILEDVQGTLRADAAADQALLHAARRNLARVLPSDESAEGAYLARYAWLREQWPECELPAIALEELLPELCQGQRSFAEVR
ncbi:MAG: ATP-dependent RNA helicase, partial [Gemmataceae bacterium]